MFDVFPHSSGLSSTKSTNIRLTTKKFKEVTPDPAKTGLNFILIRQKGQKFVGFS